MTVTTFVAQNYGANKPERVKMSLRISGVIFVATIGGISFLLYKFAGPLTLLFTDDIDVVKITTRMMTMVVTLIGTCAVRVLWILLILPNYSNPYTASYPIQCPG